MATEMLQICKNKQNNAYCNPYRYCLLKGSRIGAKICIIIFLTMGAQNVTPSKTNAP